MKHKLDGLVILCCIPTPIATSIVYTQSSGDNEAAAIKKNDPLYLVL